MEAQCGVRADHDEPVGNFRFATRRRSALRLPAKVVVRATQSWLCVSGSGLLRLAPGVVVKDEVVLVCRGALAKWLR